MMGCLDEVMEKMVDSVDGAQQAKRLYSIFASLREGLHESPLSKFYDWISPVIFLFSIAITASTKDFADGTEILRLF